MSSDEQVHGRLQKWKPSALIEADWYKQLGKFVHFFVRRPDGGGQTVWRLPASEVAEIRGESQ